MEFIDTPAGARLNRAADEAWSAARTPRGTDQASAYEAAYRRAERAQDALTWAGQDWRAQQPGHHAAVSSADGEF